MLLLYEILDIHPFKHSYSDPQGYDIVQSGKHSISYPLDSGTLFPKALIVTHQNTGYIDLTQ